MSRRDDSEWTVIERASSLRSGQCWLDTREEATLSSLRYHNKQPHPHAPPFPTPLIPRRLQRIVSRLPPRVQCISVGAARETSQRSDIALIYIHITIRTIHRIVIMHSAAHRVVEKYGANYPEPFLCYRIRMSIYEWVDKKIGLSNKIALSKSDVQSIDYLALGERYKRSIAIRAFVKYVVFRFC